MILLRDVTYPQEGEEERERELGWKDEPRVPRREAFLCPTLRSPDPGQPRRGYRVSATSGETWHAISVD